MKQAAYEETKHLRGAAYFRYIHDKVARMVPRVEYRSIKANAAAAVVESRGKYGR